EALIKSAVSFLSSPNVQSADTAKKVAFLTKKGLSAKDIEEAFRRVNQEAPSIPATATTTAAPVANAAPPAPLIPTRPTYQAGPPSVIYQPLPPAPAMPIQKLIAMAVLFGVGAVSVTAGIVSIVK
ncbi:peroxisome membrane anchor protein Pex14p, partial [Fennellomyces sp. T-0311]